MKKGTNKLIEFLSNIFWISVAGSIWGTVGGLALFILIGFTRYGFIYALIVTALFLPFHISDYKIFIRDRNWISITGRSIGLYSIGAFVSGFFATMSGLMSISIDTLDLYILFFSLLASYFCVLFWLILSNFFQTSRLYKCLLETVDGMHILGILWR